MEFIVNLEKFDLIPMQKLPWIGIEWDMINTTISLAPDNTHWTLRGIQRAQFSSTSSYRQWEDLLGYLNFAAQALPQGWLLHQFLTKKVNLAISLCLSTSPGRCSPFYSVCFALKCHSKHCLLTQNLKEKPCWPIYGYQ